jgi:urea transporter/murein DD-endopeptidase MepM/ murein hydrolase activator NlpD
MFFSDNRIFAYFIVVATFINPSAGLSGLLSLIIAYGFAKWISFDNSLITSGSLIFNSLMIGLVMGLQYQFSGSFFILLFIFSILAVLFSKAYYVVLSKYGLPFLSLPFITTFWIFLFCNRSFEILEIDKTNLYFYNELYSIGGNKLVGIYESLNNLQLTIFIESYFKSLAAIYLQHNIIAGVLIAIGLLYYSRIAFTLSIIGYATGFFFSNYVLGNVNYLTYGYIGFNYILAAISLGGFYLIPSRKSYLLAACSCVIIVILQIALMKLLLSLQLPIFSLPSALFILITLLTLKNRTISNGLELVLYQTYSPEKNLYRHSNNMERYSNNTYILIQPPFFGDWYVSQGNHGNITHKGDYSYAWDFVITDDTRKTFRLPGKELTDFHCYNVPVVAPAAGYVYQIIDGIDDNEIGNIDINNNWGNTIIIKHSEHLFSKLSHLKKESFKVYEGQYVYAGTILATCGNSGRSPEPHIHFQLQATPYIGSKTIQYPISYFITKQIEGESIFNSFEYPNENSVISSIQSTPLISNAFYFTPGKKITFEVKTTKKSIEKIELVSWEFYTDSLNQTYIYCPKTDSTAYFVNNFTLFYFTNFNGDTNSLLYYFFIGARKILLGYYDDIEVNDTLPIENFYNGISKNLQDFVAPFKLYLKPTFKAKYSSIDDLHFPKKVILKTEAEVKFNSSILKKLNFEFEINQNGIQSFICSDSKKTIEAKCVSA